MGKLIRIALTAAVFIALAGCGAKGALILPEKAAPIEAPAETTPETAAPADDAGTTPADQQAEDAVETPVQPSEGG